MFLTTVSSHETLHTSFLATPLVNYLKLIFFAFDASFLVYKPSQLICFVGTIGKFVNRTSMLMTYRRLEGEDWVTLLLKALLKAFSSSSSIAYILTIKWSAVINESGHPIAIEKWWVIYSVEGYGDRDYTWCLLTKWKVLLGLVPMSNNGLGRALVFIARINVPYSSSVI